MNKKRVCALFVGRFQPFHLGHAAVIQAILNEADELLIVIGSSQKSHDLDNPFTTGERLRMIKAALNELKIQKPFHLIPVPDSTMHALWAPKVIAYCPPFDVVYSNEPLTRRLFKEAGITVQNTPMFHRERYSATEIRRRILSDEDWRSLLPTSVVRVIEEIDGVKRLKELATTDSPYGATKRNP
ncbi:hypothetical protein AC480_06165 [miscellaneous Crenarchaeota group archaeon SMTZ1-55]|nr:MAG: hypothetical protein AC480_06165 [miscellaneous Crenarchaeota group archaeon SMTZ1-55]